MTAVEQDGDRLTRFAAMVFGVGVVGLCCAYGLARGQQERTAALLGVAEAVFSGGVALVLKRRALAKSVKGALGVMAAVFALRMVLVTAGLLYLAHVGWGVVAFVLGFFGAYFPLQWIEVSYVLAATKRRGQGGV